MPTSVSLFEKIFEHVEDGVLYTRSDGRILRANPAACRALGRTESELLGLGRAELMVEDEHTPRLRAARPPRDDGHGRASPPSR